MRSAVVTGAAKGIGLAIVERLLGTVPSDQAVTDAVATALKN